MSVHVRAQIAAVEKIRDSGVPQGASVEFVEGWKAAFSVVLNDYRIFDLMPKLALTVDVTVTKNLFKSIHRHFFTLQPDQFHSSCLRSK